MQKQLRMWLIVAIIFNKKFWQKSILIQKAINSPERLIMLNARWLIIPLIRIRYLWYLFSKYEKTHQNGNFYILDAVGWVTLCRRQNFFNAGVGNPSNLVNFENSPQETHELKKKLKYTYIVIYRFMLFRVS